MAYLTWSLPDYVACRITQQVVEPSSTTLKVTTNFEFDTAACGNVSAVEVIGKNANGTDMAHRRTTFGYGSRCQLAESVTNVLDALNDLLEPHIFPQPADGSDRRKCPQCADGKLSCHIQKIYPLSETAEALNALAERRVMGKLVLRP